MTTSTSEKIVGELGSNLKTNRPIKEFYTTKGVSNFKEGETSEIVKIEVKGKAIHFELKYKPFEGLPENNYPVMLSAIRKVVFENTSGPSIEDELLILSDFKNDSRDIKKILSKRI